MAHIRVMTKTTRFAFVLLCAALVVLVSATVAQAATPKKIAIPESSATGWEIKARNGNYFMSESKSRVSSMQRGFSSIRDATSKRFLKSLGSRVRFTDASETSQVSVQSSYPKQGRAVYVVYVPGKATSSRAAAIAALVNYASRGKALDVYYTHVARSNRAAAERMVESSQLEASFIADYQRMATGRDARNAIVKPSHMRKIMGGVPMHSPSMG